MSCDVKIRFCLGRVKKTYQTHQQLVYSDVRLPDFPVSPLLSYGLAGNTTGQKSAMTCKAAR
jgi:hypothetical protein